MASAQFTVVLVAVVALSALGEVADDHVCKVGDIVEAVASDGRWHHGKVAECLSHGLYAVEFDSQPFKTHTADVRPVEKAVTTTGALDAAMQAPVSRGEGHTSTTKVSGSAAPVPSAATTSATLQRDTPIAEGDEGGSIDAVLQTRNVSVAASSTITATTTANATSKNTRTMTVTTTQTQTHTSSTATTTLMTTSTTSTTTEYCFSEEVSWGPLDMIGTQPSKEIDEMACQRRCLQTDGCFHFSYWKMGGFCHLQDILALRQEMSIGFMSGPFQCWNYLEDPVLTRHSRDVFIPKQFHCMEIGVTFTPATAVPSRMLGAQTDMIVACQSLCRLSVGCAHFSLEGSSRLCHLSGKDATPLPGDLNSISGPPLCGEKADIFMQKKFSPVQVEDAGSRFARTLGVSILVVGLFLGIVPMGRQLWKRSSKWRREVVIQDPQEPLHGDTQAAKQLLDEEFAEDGDGDME